MIGALTLLLVFQLIGEALARGLGMPIPGPVIGMGLMFLALVLRKGPNDELRGTATGILQHLSLLFVPAGTGVMLHFQRLADEWLPLTVALVLSTLLSIAVSALLLNTLARRTKSKGEQA
ncbi:CidA/LrgA family protein [Aromatoleum diolicum]|uniref:CidA/LrgA family protein n=1 Tax=Aromatoleum diolicum TaxID=75796 RepID=A0ABX1QHU1_9RHOO|nr:CidA/LrgA family protein [Aromatoleum diolicum]NMG76616.1 CidA/LrgA family protein [Aromatoleum diolicum]